jgi:hypothetical protein
MGCGNSKHDVEGVPIPPSSHASCRQRSSLEHTGGEELLEGAQEASPRLWCKQGIVSLCYAREDMHGSLRYESGTVSFA